MGAAGLLLAGGGLQAFGQLEATNAESRAQARNAALFREQAELEAAAGKQEEGFFRQDVDKLIGAQEGAFAKAGVDVSGSPALKLLKTREKEEVGARNIKDNTRRKVRAARLRARQAQEQADFLRGPIAQFIQPLGTVFGASGRAAAASA